MIEVSHLTKRYGSIAAVDDISFTIQEGDVLGFLGPNGAGKSTTMNMLTGYLSATSGSIKIDGYDILEKPNEAKKRIGFLPEQPPLYLDMTVRDYLNFIYNLKGVKLKRKAHIHEICGLVKIEDVYDRIIKNLSKGYRQRVGLAQALVGNPPILILDEPTVGLDPKQIIEIRNLIKQLGKNHTIIFSTHILSEIQAACERVLVINRGVLVADDTTDHLSTALTGENKLTLRASAPADELLRQIKALEGTRYAEILGIKEKGTVDLLIETQPGMDIRKSIFRLMVEKDWPIMGLKTTDLDLEDIFIRLTSEEKSGWKDKKRIEKKKAEEKK